MPPDRSDSASNAALPSALPPLSRRSDGLSDGQRRAMVLAVAGAHVAALWGLLQVKQVRDAVAEAAPMFVSLVAPDAPKPIELPPPPPPPPRPAPQRPAPSVIAAAPSPAPAPAFVVAPPVEQPPAPAAVAEAPAPVPAPPAPPAPAPAPAAPRFIPPSAVQYVRQPDLQYPSLSKRNREQGKVLLVAWCDEQGHPSRISVSTSSGYARLDAAAVAAVGGALFKPYTEGGKALGGWVQIPLEFVLES